MRVKINAKELTEALKICAADPRAVIDILRAGVFTPNDSSMSITGTDHSVYTTQPVQCTYLDEKRESFCIEISRVVSAISGVDGSVIIETQAKGVVITDEDQRFKYQIKSYNPKDFPSRLPIDSEIETGYDPLAIKRFLPYAGGLIDSLETNQGLKSLHFNDGFLACITRNRLVFGQIGGDIKPVLLPRHGATLLQNILTGESVITVGIVKDSYDRLIVRTGLSEANFVLTQNLPVNWQRICKPTDTASASFVFDSAELVAAVNRLASFVDNKKGLAGVDVTVEGQTMTFSVEESGRPIPIHEKVNCEVSGEPHEDRINLVYLYQTVNKLNKSKNISWHQWPTKQEGTAFVSEDETVYFKLSCLIK